MFDNTNSKPYIYGIVMCIIYIKISFYQTFLQKCACKLQEFLCCLLRDAPKTPDAVKVWLCPWHRALNSISDLSVCVFLYRFLYDVVLWWDGTFKEKFKWSSGNRGNVWYGGSSDINEPSKIAYGLFFFWNKYSWGQSTSFRSNFCLYFSIRSMMTYIAHT